MHKPPSSDSEFEALGTHWVIKFESPEQLDKHSKDLLELVIDFENTYSRFKPDSQISMLNRDSSLEKPSEELRDMLTFALDMYKTSAGAFDISIGGELEKKGYGATTGVARSKNLEKDLIITSEQITMKNGVHLDFGGFGKGWLIDKIDLFLKEHSLNRYVINGGGDIFVRSDNPEEILISDPADGKRFYGTILLTDKALAASSNQIRQWKQNGNTHSHIPDARDDELLSLHVIADSAASADALATTMMTVDRPRRMMLAKKFDVQFLEILRGGKSFRTTGFHWQPNS